VIDVLELLEDSAVAAESSIILTYELDLPIYEGWVRRRLTTAGAVNQVLFCDVDIYARELDGLPTARHIGRTYSATPVRRPGAFHPKVYLLLGRKKGRLLIGSGNVTIGGLLKNAELFGRFDYDQDSGIGPHQAFVTVVDLVEELASVASGVVRKQLARALSWAPWLRQEPTRDHRTLLVAGPGRPSLIDQLRPMLRGVKPRSAVVVSASFDRKLDGVKKLAGLTSERRVRCIVQPDFVDLDGKIVEDLRGTAQWYPFVDPYPREKRRRRDVRSHAKLIVFDCAGRELVLYGSANCSKPALVEADANTEVVVASWHDGPPSILEVLGLDKSLARTPIDKDLVRKTWREDDEGDGSRKLVCVLSGAVSYGQRVELTVSNGKPPHDALAEFSDRVNAEPLLRRPIRERESGRFETAGRAPEEARVVRLVGRSGRPVSNFVAFTAPELGEVRGRSSVGSRAEAAIAAMQDGVVLGTVLFELLDHYRDIEIVLARPAGHRRPLKEPATEKRTDSEPRAVETFYTDAAAGRPAPELWIGDRADLDLLASLVQPLSGVRRATALDDDEEDDSAIEEEAERREIDAKGGRAAGDERRQSVRFASREALERAARRLASRLERSALSIEDALGLRAEAVAVRASSIARQIWMTHIAAFLAERRVLSAENEEVRCLDASAFARYVLRVCRALSGGKDRGVLSLLAPDVWKGPDGETLQRGLAFLWTCCVWATAHFRRERVEEKETIWEMIPDLVAARFIAAVKGYCKSPDKQDVSRRLPAYGDAAGAQRWEDQTARLAGLIMTTEAKGEPARKVVGDVTAVQPGALVFHRATGITVLADREPWANGTYSLLDLSKDDNVVRKFTSGVIAVQADGWPVRWDPAAARSLGIE
jgi:hypothetical protein